jgi:hypothetical protein
MGDLRLDIERVGISGDGAEANSLVRFASMAAAIFRF